MCEKQAIRDITIVSLSKGTVGESFVGHEVPLGLERLQSLGCRVHFSAHALDGIDSLLQHPEHRAQDLIDAFQSDTDMILCAVGGEDTYRLLPYLFEEDRLQNALRRKIFLGFSDTTANHFMLHKLGLNTFYGQAFLPDICDLGKTMLPYSARYLEELIRTGSIARITPSDVWYDSREDFSPAALGTCTPSHPNGGFVLLQGAAHFEGKILGGCIDTIYDFFDGTRDANSPEVCRKYGLFPSLADWAEKILLLESSEEKASPEKYRRMVTVLKEYGLFGVISGVLIGKPADETYFEEYKQILREVIADPQLPVAVNINIGHALPRCIIPFGVPAEVDIEKQQILFSY